MWMLSRYGGTCIHKSVKLSKYISTDYSKWKVLFFGTDDFSLTHLLTLHKVQTTGVLRDLAVVVSNKKCLVHEYARKAGIQTFTWPLSNVHDYNLGVVVSFGHFIPEAVINQFKNGMINVHPSLLPRWRGAAPIEHTILSGDTKTGVSIMKIKPKLDQGPVLLQQVVPVPENTDIVELRKSLATLGSEMLQSVLENVETLSANSTEQDPNLVTYARKVCKTHANINWENTMNQIDKQYRALFPKFKLRSSYKDKVVHLLNMIPICVMKRQTIPEIEESIKDYSTVLPGYPFYLRTKELLCIKCKDGWVGFDSIVINKTMTAKSFYNGYLSKEENKDIFFTSIDNDLEKFPHWTANSS